MNTLKQQQPPTPSIESGFTLIECLVAIIIVGVLMVAIAPAVVLSAATRLQARRVELATQAARTYVDGVRAGNIPAPPYAVLATKENLFANVVPTPTGSATWQCTPKDNPFFPLKPGTLPVYCPDASGSVWLYCVNRDGQGCSANNHTNFVIQAFRTIPPSPTTPTQPDPSYADGSRGYALGIRVYRADALDGKGTVRTSVDPNDLQKRAKRQLAHTAGVGDNKAPVLELTTEIAPADAENDPSSRWKSLCSRLGGCTSTPTASPSP